MRTCHLCHNPWSAHASDCRVQTDLERMRRVLDRLIAERREPALRDRMSHYLGQFGNLPCQVREDMPTASECRDCDHRDLCVIQPDSA